MSYNKTTEAAYHRGVMIGIQRAAKIIANRLDSSEASAIIDIMLLELETDLMFQPDWTDAMGQATPETPTPEARGFR